MLCIVQCKGPEAFDWRQFAFGKRYRISVLTLERFALAVIVGVNVLRFLRSIVVNVRLSGSSAIKVIGAPLGIVHWRVPAVTSGTTVVAPLKEGRDYLALGRCSSLRKRPFNFRVFGRSVYDATDPVIECLLARQ